MGAGSVMHALDGETDLKRMRGLRVALPFTFACFIIGWLAISGVPPLSGFFAKDQILATASHSGRTLAWAVGLLAAFFSALYISRVVFLAFFGSYRSGRNVHDPPRTMRGPMTVLAAAAVVGGVLGISTVNGIIPRFLAPVAGKVAEGHHGLSTIWLAIISVAVAGVGIAIGWLIYGVNRVDWVALRVRLGALHSALRTGWFFDQVYSAVLVLPGKAVAAFLAYVFDQRVIDGAVQWVGRGVTGLAGAGRRVQSGLVRTYALAFLAGVVAILWYVAARS